MIHFDFDDRHEEELVVGSAISARGGVVLSTGFHALILALILFGPKWTFLEFLKPDPAELAERQEELLRQLRERQQNRRFVYIPPEVPDIEAPEPPPNADPSDINRKAQALERAKEPVNPLPFSRGNTPEKTVSPPPPELARGDVVEAPPTPEPPKPEAPKPEPPEQVARALPPANTGLRRSVETSRPLPSGRLGDALRNLDQYVRNQTFNNPQGGLNDPGSSLQFDTAGVDFGPWSRRFLAQVERNWIIPNAAMIDRGHVVLEFVIHRDGRITNLRVVKPSHNPAFNRAAYNAINSSSPVEPLPPEFPFPAIDPVEFTFYYNEFGPN